MSAIYQFELTGVSPLLMHNDDIRAADEVNDWLAAAKKLNKKTAAGDDRYPPWKWITYCYINEGQLVIPSDNLMVGLRDAGKRIIYQKKESYQRLTQTSLLPSSDYFEFRNAGQAVPMDKFLKMREQDTAEFMNYLTAVHKGGFDLHVKRARNPSGQTKQVRVRPKFDQWSLSGCIEVIDDLISLDIFTQLLSLAGSYGGLCDWRPGSKTPGRMGMFTATATMINQPKRFKKGA